MDNSRILWTTRREVVDRSLSRTLSAALTCRLRLEGRSPGERSAVLIAGNTLRWWQRLEAFSLRISSASVRHRRGHRVENSWALVDTRGIAGPQPVDKAVARSPSARLWFVSTRGVCQRERDQRFHQGSPGPGSATGDSIKGDPRGHRGSAPWPSRWTTEQRQGTEAGRSGRFLPLA